MTERERTARRLRVLQARLQQDWSGVEQVYRRVRMSADRVHADGPDAVTVGAAALYLQNFYTAVEELLGRIAAELDGSLPGGEQWHRELLRQLSLDLPEIRPAILDDQLHAELDLLRRFRHLVRHAYTAEYDWTEMASVVAAAAYVEERLPTTLAQLDGWLARTIGVLEGPT